MTSRTRLTLQSSQVCCFNCWKGLRSARGLGSMLLALPPHWFVSQAACRLLAAPLFAACLRQQGCRAARTTTPSLASRAR